MIILFALDLILSSSLSDWDFSGLALPTCYESDYLIYTYQFNFRKGVVSNNSLCDVANCVFFEMYALFCHCYGTIDTENITIFPDDSGMNLTYSYGMYISHFTLNCANSLSYSANYSGNNGYVELNAPQGCKKSNSKKGKSRLGWGFVVFLLVVIPIFLYFAVGIPVSYYVFKNRGIEVLPFILYITSFFGMVGYGAKFVFLTIFSSCRTGVGAGRDGYTSL